jgi:4-hydroxythreonine-4-phosphate dehydrogenase
MKNIMENVRIGITVGDINGIGLEVILKTLADRRILDVRTPVVYGSSKVVSYHRNIVQLEDFQYQNLRAADRLAADKLNIVNCWQENVSISLGKANSTGGKYALLSIEKAVEDLKQGFIDAIVTGPINKNAMHLAGFGHIGHTEYLADQFGTHSPLMLMVGDTLKVGLVTEHIPISAVAAAITTELLLHKINLLHKTLIVDFGIERPTIAVLGLNPHAGDEGLIGSEDDEIIKPAIAEAKKSGLLVNGPFPADGFFGSSKFNKYDGILAMYHDQGLAPFKALNFSSGVNFTAGLPVIRTSPDHGTAYDIAGKNMADPESFRKALFLAVDMVRNRKEYYEMTSNAVQRVELESEKADETSLPID